MNIKITQIHCEFRMLPLLNYRRVVAEMASRADKKPLAISARALCAKRFILKRKIKAVLAKLYRPSARKCGYKQRKETANKNL